MSWFSSIDLYCERTAVGLWDEPLNAVSNVVFVVAAYWGWRRVRRRGGMKFTEAAIVILAGLIGVGSALFHTFANSWSEMADVVPIWTFVAGYVSLVIYREHPEKFPLLASLALVIGAAFFWLTSDDISTNNPTAGVSVEDPFNGSLQYAPAILALMIFAVVSHWRKRPFKKWLTVAIAVFAAALVFRTIDLHTCTQTGVGTHFVWHLLCGVLIGLLLYVLIVHIQPSGRAVQSSSNTTERR